MGSLEEVFSLMSTACFLSGCLNELNKSTFFGMLYFAVSVA